MNVYFFSKTPCALFADGARLGTADGFARRTQLSPADGVFCECKAAGRVPFCFFFNEDFLFAPPEGAELYFYRGDVAVCVQELPYSDPAARTVWRRTFGALTLTLRVQGRVLPEMAGAEERTLSLPFAFERCRAEEAGGGVLLEGDGMFALLSGAGELRTLSAGRVVGRGARLTAEVPLFDCLGSVLICRYEGGVLHEGTRRSARSPDEALLPLALFESVLSGFDAAPLLSPLLAPKAALLKGYLGDLRAAVRLGDELVGAVYERKPRVFDVRPFRVTTEGGKVSNLAPA